MPRPLPILAVLLLLPSPAVAQAITGYELRVYAPGAAMPQSTTPFPATAVQCNQPQVTTTNTTNPTRVVWTDPALSGRECIWTFGGGGVIPSLPSGAYEGALLAINDAGSAESARAPFVRLDVPAAPGGVRLLR